MNRTVLDFWVGLFVLAGILALLFLALRAGSVNVMQARDSYEVVARFGNVGGLKLRAPVKSAGVVVGRVSDIRFDTEEYEAKVVLRIDKRYPFPRDASAAILTSGLLGEQYIDLAAGGDTVMLKDGDTIRITQDAVILEKLIGQFLFGTAQEGAKE